MNLDTIAQAIKYVKSTHEQEVKMVGLLVKGGYDLEHIAIASKRPTEEIAQLYQEYLNAKPN